MIMKTLFVLLVLSIVAGCKMSDLGVFCRNTEDEDARRNEMERAMQMQQALEDTVEKSE